MDDVGFEYRIEGLLYEYLENIKPLLTEIRSRVKEQDSKLLGLNNEIRALNDHIARCYREGATDENRHDEIKHAREHYQRLFYDCFKLLNVNIYQIIEKKTNQSFSPYWLKFNNGQFWEKYDETLYLARSEEKQAKIAESIDSYKACEHYNKAYLAYRQIEELLKDNESMLRKSRLLKIKNKLVGGGRWLLWTLGLSIVSGLLTYLVGN